MITSQKITTDLESGRRPIWEVFVKTEIHRVDQKKKNTYGGPGVEITWSGRSVAHQPKGGWIRSTQITKIYILIDFLKLESGDNSKKPSPI
jgi:hypothetical protein